MGTIDRVMCLELGAESECAVGGNEQDSSSGRFRSEDAGGLFCARVGNPGGQTGTGDVTPVTAALARVEGCRGHSAGTMVSEESP